MCKTTKIGPEGILSWAVRNLMYEINREDALIGGVYLGEGGGRGESGNAKERT